jgi:hypothetical protein
MTFDLDGPAAARRAAADSVARHTIAPAAAAIDATATVPVAVREGARAVLPARPAEAAAVVSSVSGSTRTCPTTGMKLVSPFQRGTRCTCT